MSRVTSRFTPIRRAHEGRANHAGRGTRQQRLDRAPRRRLDRHHPAVRLGREDPAAHTQVVDLPAAGSRNRSSCAPPRRRSSRRPASARTRAAVARSRPTCTRRARGTALQSSPWRGVRACRSDARAGRRRWRVSTPCSTSAPGRGLDVGTGNRNSLFRAVVGAYARRTSRTRRRGISTWGRWAKRLLG